jgi:hypothetical protein
VTPARGEFLSVSVKHTAWLLLLHHSYSYSGVSVEEIHAFIKSVVRVQNINAERLGGSLSFRQK